MGSAASFVVRDAEQPAAGGDLDASGHLAFNDIDIVFTVDFDAQPEVAAAKVCLITCLTCRITSCRAREFCPAKAGCATDNRLRSIARAFGPA
jgi:hypothetical protein